MTQSKHHRTTHGKTDSAIYRVWCHMKRRCNNPNDPAYKYYGGRGINVCSRWQSFEPFYADMGNPPPDMELDRTDNDKGYYKDNCRWVSHQDQSNNRRSTLKILYKGKTATLRYFAEKFNIRHHTLYQRLQYGWSVEKAMSTPTRRLTKDITYNGKTKTLKAWSISLGGTPGLIAKRLRTGWSIEKAITTPINKRKSHVKNTL